MPIMHRKTKIFPMGGLTEYYMSRIVETIRRPEDNRNKCISRNYVPLLLTLIVALALMVASVEYILNGGNLPNVHRGLSLIVLLSGVYRPRLQIINQDLWRNTRPLILVRSKVKYLRPQACLQ